MYVYMCEYDGILYTHERDYDYENVSTEQVLKSISGVASIFYSVYQALEQTRTELCTMLYKTIMYYEIEYPQRPLIPPFESECLIPVL